MKTTLISFFVIFSACSLLLSCSTEETDSQLIKTEGLWANFSAVSDGERTRVVAEINVGGENGTNVRLSEGDEITAQVGTQKAPLEFDEDFLDIDYQAYFSATASGTNINIDFERNNESLISSASLPESFTLQAPTNKTLYLSNQLIDVIWDAHSDISKQINLSISISCTGASKHEQFILEDDGVHSIDFSLFDIWQDINLDPTKNCDVKFTLTRENNGVISQRLASGSKIAASQRRTVNVNMNIVNF